MLQYSEKHYNQVLITVKSLYVSLTFRSLITDIDNFRLVKQIKDLTIDWLPSKIAILLIATFNYFAT